eukprot:gene2518-biopygen9562
MAARARLSTRPPRRHPRPNGCGHLPCPLVSRRSCRAGPVPAPLWKEACPVFPKRCWSRSGTPRTATDQRRRNRAPGDPGDPRGSGGAGQAPYGSRSFLGPGFAGAGQSMIIWRAGH